MIETIKALLKKFRLLWFVRMVRCVYGMIYCWLERNARYFYSYISFITKKKRDCTYNVSVRPRKTISLLCPTRERLASAKRLVKSVYRTAVIPERIEILFYVDADDIQKDAYQLFAELTKNIFKRLLRCEFFIGEPMSISKSCNILASRSKGDVLILSNDDQVYVDYGWDICLDNEVKKFPDGIYCMWFNEGLTAGRNCLSPIVSRKWYETLGYFTPGIFEFWNNDTWIEDIARKIDRLHYIPNMLVQHLHYMVGRSWFDKTYHCHVDKGDHERDYELLKNTDRDREIAAEKLRRVMDNDRNKMEGEK